MGGAMICLKWFAKTEGKLMKIESLYRYPVKGLTPERLSTASLSPGNCIPFDRAFALAQGDADLDTEHPAWISKVNFLCLAKNPAAARLRTNFDETTNLLTIHDPQGEDLIASPFTEEGSAALTTYLTAFLGPEARYGTDGQQPNFHHFPKHSFCDHKTQVISLIGLGSLAALEEAVGAPREKLRFRANIYIEGAAPWTEFELLGKTLAIGEVRMVVQERIDRCPATMVNPDTAEKDANPVKELRQHFGHIDMGVFAEVLCGGVVRAGDEIRVIGPI
jgi:uncharacterized protein YcbX